MDPFGRNETVCFSESKILIIRHPPQVPSQFIWLDSLSSEPIVDIFFVPKTNNRIELVPITRLRLNGAPQEQLSTRPRKNRRSQQKDPSHSSLSSCHLANNVRIMLEQMYSNYFYNKEIDMNGFLIDSKEPKEVKFKIDKDEVVEMKMYPMPELKEILLEQPIWYYDSLGTTLYSMLPKSNEVCLFTRKKKKFKAIGRNKAPRQLPLVFGITGHYNKDAANNLVRYYNPEVLYEFPFKFEEKKEKIHKKPEGPLTPLKPLEPLKPEEKSAKKPKKGEKKKEKGKKDERKTEEAGNGEDEKKPPKPGKKKPDKKPDASEQSPQLQMVGSPQRQLPPPELMRSSGVAQEQEIRAMIKHEIDDAIKDKVIPVLDRYMKGLTESFQKLVAEEVTNLKRTIESETAKMQNTVTDIDINQV